MSRILAALTALSLALVLPAPAAQARPQTDPHLANAQRAFDEGNYFTSIQELKASIVQRPTKQAYLMLGNANVQIGAFEAARDAFTQALELERSPAKREMVKRLIENLGNLTRAKLKIVTNPPGATIYVDLKAAGPRGQSPLEVPVIPGRHRVIASLEGYDDEIAVPDPLAIEDQEVVVSLLMRQKGCDLALSAQQRGVMASVDGEDQLGLPATVRVTPGIHQVVFNGRGMVPRHQSVECKDYQPLQLDGTLEGTAGGVLVIHSAAGTNIRVDGQAITPKQAEGMALETGLHDVEIEAAGNAPWHAKVQVRSGEQVELRPEFHRAGMGITGVEVTPIPADAKVFLDGEPIEGGIMTATRPGAHEVEARALGHRPFHRSLDLRPGEVTRVEARLQKNSPAPLAAAIALSVISVGAEATAIAAHVKAGRELLGTPPYARWHGVELAGHVTAGACAAGAIVGYVLDGLQRRSGLETPKNGVKNGVEGGKADNKAYGGVRLTGGVAPMTGGGALTLSGSF